MTKSPSLVWSPTNEYVADRIRHEKRLLFLIAPFIKLDALKQLVSICDDTSELQIIVRWNAKDLLAGASDLEIYPYLTDHNIPLYTHPDIHLKLFIFTDALAFHTSGNITHKGLGLAKTHNIEIGCEVGLTPNDWLQLLRILDQSNRVDDEVHQTAMTYLETNKSTSPPLPPLDLQPKVDKRFSRLSLPSSSNPDALYAFYQDSDNEKILPEAASAFMHDLLLYGIPMGLPKEVFFATLSGKFKAHPFVLEIVNLIKAAGSARFGLVNEWITANCSDKPTPYRWEMKTATRRLYDWLAYFFTQISWDIPGSHSMVIRWA